MLSEWGRAPFPGRIFNVPEYEVIDTSDRISSILYEGEPYRGRTTRHFAYVGVPDAMDATSLPGVVCVHGGGGTAFREWVTLWNRRGYAAISMDLGGRGPGAERLQDGGPEDDLEQKFFDLFRLGWEDSWTYHAVSAVIRAHSLLRSLPRVEGEKTALTGISWGGYLTCIAPALDRRFRCAAPVYGCGFLQHNSKWLGTFDKMKPDQRKLWHALCDPSAYLGRVRSPMLFVNGTNDGAYPLDSYRMSYRLVRAPKTLLIRPGLEHSQQVGSRLQEIKVFVDYHLRTGPRLPQVGVPSVDYGTARCSVESERGIARAALLYTRDRGDWFDRAWHEMSAEVTGDACRAELPHRVATWFFCVRDEAGHEATSLISSNEGTNR